MKSMTLLRPSRLVRLRFGATEAFRHVQHQSRSAVRWTSSLRSLSSARPLPSQPSEDDHVNQEQSVKLWNRIHRQPLSRPSRPPAGWTSPSSIPTTTTTTIPQQKTVRMTPPEIDGRKRRDEASFGLCEPEEEATAKPPPPSPSPPPMERIRATSDATLAPTTALTYTGNTTMPITTRLQLVTPDDDTPRGIWPVFRLMVRACVRTIFVLLFGNLCVCVCTHALLSCLFVEQMLASWSLTFDSFILLSCPVRMRMVNSDRSSMMTNQPNDKVRLHHFLRNNPSTRRPVHTT